MDDGRRLASRTVAAIVSSSSVAAQSEVVGKVDGTTEQSLALSIRPLATNFCQNAISRQLLTTHRSDPLCRTEPHTRQYRDITPLKRSAIGTAGGAIGQPRDDAQPLEDANAAPQCRTSRAALARTRSACTTCSQPRTAVCPWAWCARRGTPLYSVFQEISNLPNSRLAFALVWATAEARTYHTTRSRDMCRAIKDTTHT